MHLSGPTKLNAILTYDHQTALQHYCRLYKQEKVAQAHALLRKARRLDLIVGVRNDLQPTEDVKEPDRRCHECQSQYSPAFYEMAPAAVTPFVPSGDATAWLCHKCHFPTIQSTTQPAVDEPMPMDHTPADSILADSIVVETIPSVIVS